MILHDQHIHSKYSHDSTEEISNYLEIAKKRGCLYFVTTEHYDLDAVSFFCDLIADFTSLQKELKSYQKQYPTIKMLLGIELGYKKDRIKDLEQVLNSYDFDVINLSIHDGNNVDFYIYDTFLKKGEVTLLNEYFDLIIEATTNFTHYNVLSHIDYGFKTVYLVNNKIKISAFEEKIKQIFTNIIKHGKTLEINTKVQEAINDDNHLRYILNLYYQMGGRKLTLSSDAHKSERYASRFEHYQKIIKACGFNYLVYFVKQKEYKYFI